MLTTKKITNLFIDFLFGQTNIKIIDQSFSLNEPIGMLTKFYFLIFLFFISVQSTPIDCLSAGEAVILEQDPCENKDVCRLHRKWNSETIFGW
jgi:hypothetical protein